MNNNVTRIVLGVIVGLALGGFGGYTMGTKESSNVSVTAQVEQMTEMMKEDGVAMARMGGMMMNAGKMMEEGGTKYGDQAMVMMGKDLSANGKKHEADGKSMMGSGMMGMGDMPGMDHSGM